MRMQAIRAHTEGVAAEDIAKANGVALRSVYRWLAAFFNGGQDALKAIPLTGRAPKLSDEDVAWVVRAIRDDSPLQHKFVFGLWTLRLIQELILRKFEKSLAISSVWRLMKLMGFSSQKPLYEAIQQDAVLVRKWEFEVFPSIKKAAKKAGATIFFADEAGIRSNTRHGTTWAPTGETPVVAATGKRFGLNMLSAISAQGELKFMVHEGTANAETFIEFLTRLLTGASTPIYLIVDGHSIHTCAKTTEFVKSKKGKLKIFVLPPYSPQLNPSEGIWSNVKRVVAKQIPSSLDELERITIDALLRLKALPETVIAFFRQPECDYALR